MPMEIFVGCVGDLATLEGSELFVTPACCPPGSFCFCPRGLRKWKVLLWHIPCAATKLSSWRGGEESRSQEQDTHCLDKYSAGA